MSRIIFIIGQSGAGKDTLSDNLAKYFERNDQKTLFLSSGGELRKFTATDTYTAHLAKENNEQGRLAPRFTIVGCWFNKLNSEYTGEETIIWNGSPRTVKEFEIIREMVQFYNMEADVLHLKLSDEICLERILARERVEKREETGSLEAINTKMKFFHQEVVPAIEAAKGDANFTVHEIDGEGTREEVFERVKQVLQI